MAILKGQLYLKEGFKETYGKPVFQYLLDYKMELAWDKEGSKTHD